MIEVEAQILLKSEPQICTIGVDGEHIATRIRQQDLA